MRRFHRPTAPDVAAFLLVGLICGIARWSAGPTLGVLFAGFAACAIVVPPLAAFDDCPFRWLLYAALAALAAMIIWAATALPYSNHGDLPFAAATLLTFACACAGIATIAQRAGIPATASAGLTTLLALAWLTWPIWLAHNLTGPNAQRISDALVNVHPLLTMNERLLDWGVWTERPLTYSTSALGQDLPYSPPATPLACILFNAALSIPALIADTLRTRGSAAPSLSPGTPGEGAG